MKILFVKVKRALSKSGLPDIDYALNPYIGCLHGCIYCYARLYTRNREVSSNWGEIVIVKENLLEVLGKETKYLRRGIVGVGTITDPYQPVEAIYRLTRRSVEKLLEEGFHVSMQTKNTLILRDLDILSEHSDRVDVGFTITSLSDEKARIYEPKSSPPTMRAYALRKLASSGINTWIFYGPVIPGYNDDLETIKNIILLAKMTKSKVLIDHIHVKKFMYENNHPLKPLLPRIKRYSWNKFYERTMRICKEYGVKCIRGYAEPDTKTLTLDAFT